MDTLKTWIHKTADFLGVFVPTITFSVIFITFMISIISRYILKQPVAWSTEISVLAYIWTMFFATGKALDQEDHVMFGLVYDGLGEKRQRALRVLYYALIALMLCIAFPACAVSLVTKKGVTGVLQISYSIVFAPFLLMFADVIIRCARAVWRELRPEAPKGGN